MRAEPQAGHRRATAAVAPPATATDKFGIKVCPLGGGSVSPAQMPPYDYAGTYVTTDQAARELARLSGRLGEQFASSNRGWIARPVPLLDDLDRHGQRAALDERGKVGGLLGREAAGDLRAPADDADAALHRRVDLR